MSPSEQQQTRAGFLFAFSAFTTWGLLPLFWKLSEGLDPIEITAHRAIWSLPVAFVVCLALGRTGDIIPTLKSPRQVGILFVSTMLVTFNWAVFIWAVAHDHVLDAALAYFINPLISVLLGYVFLGERFNRLQLIAIILAATAVLMLTFVGGQFPWISISLALTFGLYGLLRKTVDVGPTQGFLVEIMLIFPIAAGFVLWKLSQGNSVLTTSVNHALLMVLAGPATAIPLILFALGAKRLRLSSVGLMQFIVPTIMFLIGLFVFGEPLEEVELYAFILIWIAIAIYVWSVVGGNTSKMTPHHKTLR